MAERMGRGTGKTADGKLDTPLGPVPICCGSCQWWEFIETSDGSGVCYGSGPPKPEVGAEGSIVADWPITEEDARCRGWEGDECSIRKYLDRHPIVEIHKPDIKLV